MATRLVYVLIVLSSLHLERSAATIATGADCVSGNDTCTDPQATCKVKAGTSGGTTCECNANYYADSGKCTTVLGSACTNNADGNTTCLTTRGLANSVCSSSKCTCKSGFYENNHTCAEGVDLNGNCSGVAADLKNIACQAKNAKTTCKTSGEKSLCTCNTGYYNDTTTTSGRSCVAVLKTSCKDETKCGEIDSNAECTGTTDSKTCNCKSGYTGKAGDVCSASAVGRNSASFWLLVCHVLLTAKGILL